MKGVEHLPGAFGGATHGLDEALGRFIDELRLHQNQGCRGSTCAFQRSVPRGPDEGVSFTAVERKPVREDPYEDLWR